MSISTPELQLNCAIFTKTKDQFTKKGTHPLQASSGVPEESLT